jgi:hypothetical protein
MQNDAFLTPSMPVDGQIADAWSLDDSHASCEEYVNIGHMELLLHAMLNEDMYNFAVGFQKFRRSGIAPRFETALTVPYLMHQVLAFSACHLAHVNPARAAYFHRQSVTLQTRAVSLFNKARVDVHQSNCVPILLFSSMLGQHLLADTLALRPSTGIEGFIMHYVQCIDMHRGIYNIATSAWPLLMKSELEPILSMSREFTSQLPKGDDCSLVSSLINLTDDMSEDEKHACQTAVRYLQVGLDAVQSDKDSPVSRYQMICEWTMLLPPGFTRLLAAKQPVALVVLAYYTILLHSGRHLWQVGDAGCYIFALIEEYLGSRWGTWLSNPRGRLFD